MNLHLSAQDVPRCDLCENALASSHSDFCFINLCRPCIGEHIGDEYTKHKVVPFNQRKSTVIYPMCTTHESQRCEFQCNECHIFVCSLCVSSDTHNGHTFSNLFEIYKFKKEITEKDKCELENIICPTYEAIITEIESGVAKIDGEYEHLSAAVIKCGEELRKEIEIAVEKLNGDIEEMRTKHIDVLQKHLEEIKKTRSDIQKSLETLREVTESNDVALVVEFKSRNKEFFRLPQKVEVTGPKFDPKAIDRQQLNQVIGTLLPLSPRSVEHGYTLKMPAKCLQDDPELIGAIDTGSRKLYSVTCYSDVNIWICGRYSTMKCFDNQGSLIKSVETKSGEWPCDVAVTNDGDMIYSDWATGKINMIENGQEKEIIYLEEWDPQNLCVTSSGDLLVTMSSVEEWEEGGDEEDSDEEMIQCKIVRYSLTDAKEKQTIQFDDKGNPLFSGNRYSKYICENKNYDICVADSEAGEVVVVNEAGNLRFRYRGHPSAARNQQYQPKDSSTKINTFNPIGITTDSQSQILTADCPNHLIHILDKDGHFLRLIDNCDLYSPFDLFVDKNDILHVTEYNIGKVKKVKYLE
ncbi:uncharacterized protein LOC133190852 [Saccostrea echinata]|uniref:uncharacterized protein LOC133190852 n=1 Tax=Saccostrea echinata TaxID=191078 RepID=UPI002A828D3D|nr:uncharacterized protein LOC133190852 [Saccostrea echinata]